MSDLNLQQALTYCINTGATTAESARKFGVSREALSKLIAEMLNPNGGGEVGDTTEFRNLYGDTKIVHAQLKAGNRTFYLATTGIDSVKGAKMVAFDENGREVDFEALKTKYGISSFNLEANGQITISVSKEPAEEMYIVQEADEKTGFFDTLKDYWEEGKLFFGRIVGSEIVVTQKVEQSDITFETTTPLTYANTIEQDTEIRENTVDLLLNNANNALAMIKHYRDNFGYISSDAIVQGSNVIFDKFIDSITGRNDFVTVFENEDATIEEIKKLEELKTKTKKPEEFAKAFKELYGVDFKPENFLNLTHTAERLNRMNAYAGLSKYFEFGINELKNADTSGFEPAALLAPLFGNNIIKAKEYVDDIRNQSSDENDFRNKLTAKLQEAKQNADKELKGFNRERLENEYRIRYKNAMGNEASDKIIEGYINNSQMCAMLTETGLVIAASLLTMGSSTVVNLTGKAVTKLGANAGGQLVKAGMTAAMASLPAAETLVSGITSEAGPTEEKINQAWEELKNGLMYGAFGAYVSGPLGNVVSKALSKNPQIFKEIVSSTKFSMSAGTAVETTADVLFDRLTSDLTFKESMAQNGIMNFGMMFVGGRIHNKTQLPDVDMSQIKIEKMKDGTFNLIANDRVFYKTKDENKLAFVTLVLGAKSKTKIEANNPSKNKYTKSSQSPMFEDLQYSKKSNNTPNLRNNSWVQEDFARELAANKDFPREEIDSVLAFTDKDNIDFARELVANKDFPREEIAKVLCLTNKDKLDFARELVANKDYPRDKITEVLGHTNKDNLNLARELVANKDFPREQIARVLEYTDKDNLNLARELVADKDLPRDKIAEVLRYTYTNEVLRDTNKDKLDFARELVANKDFPREKIDRVLRYTNKDNLDFARELVANKDFQREEIDRVLRYTNKDNLDFARELVANKDFQREEIANVLCLTNKDKLDFARELVANKDFPRDKITEVLWYTNKDNLDFARELVANKDFPKNQTARVLEFTNKDNLDFASELVADKDFPRDKIAKVIQHYNYQSKTLFDLIVSRNDIKSSVLANITDCIICKDGAIRGQIDTNKVKRYTALLENPKTSPFMVKKLNDGMDIDTAAFLLKTQQKLDGENAAKQQANKKSQVQNYSTDQQTLNKQFTALGLSENESKAIIKAVSADGSVNIELRNKAVELIELGVAKNRIGDILTSAQITGQYNSKIIDDFVSLQGLGLNPLLEKNLAILNNLSGKEVAEKFNSKVKKQIIGMLENLPESKKILLESKGVELNSIIEKLKTQQIRLTQAAPQKVKLPEDMRMSKSKLTGFERIVVDKYNPNQKIWMSEAKCKEWAEDKYNDFKNGDYKSMSYPSANKNREKILNEWFEFMDTEPEIKDNPFVKIIISDYITKDVEPENAWLPPAFDKALIKEVLNSAMQNSSISISATYAKKLKAKAENSTLKEEVFVDGIKGTWYTVPQTDKSSPNFQTNADKLKAFSDGTNWCIRTYNAESYVQEGAMHFFVDENGLTQVCVREDAPGRVYEIQKRQQNGTRPIPYITVVKDFLDRYNLKTTSGYLDAALNAKPKFDEQKKSFNEAAKRGDYKYILEQMGITVEVLPDGTYAISHYSPALGEYTINDLGIKENDLLSNVSIIRGNAIFENSNATTLPKLTKVGGKFTFDSSNISDVRNLKEINGYKIEWE